MILKRDIIATFSLALFAVSLRFIEARSGQTSQNEYEIKVNVGLTVLPVTVTDHKDHRVAGLKKQDFKIFEDGRPQEISFFETEDAPVTVGLLVDNSLSMQPDRPAITAAAVTFARSCNPNDQIFVVNFNERVVLDRPQGVPFTRNPEELRAALASIRSSGRTALYDAIAVALEHLKQGTAGRKYLIVVSDGGDNVSHHSKADIMNMARNSNAAIYAVGVTNQSFAGEDLGVLKKLAKVTGGEFYEPQTIPEVVGSFKTIARSIREQYTLGYVPTDQAEDGKFRAIRVMVSAPHEGRLTAHTRAGYLAPAPPTAQATTESSRLN